MEDRQTRMKGVNFLVKEVSTKVPCFSTGVFTYWSTAIPTLKHVRDEERLRYTAHSRAALLEMNNV